MKKQIFIIIGAIIVLVLILIWAYLLVFGTPKSAADIYADLGLGGEVDPDLVVIPEPVVKEETPLVNIKGEKLRQLTTRPVAGFKEVQTGTNGSSLYYIEMGTGHLYSIDLATGAESRLSGTTIAQANQAAFSNDGTYVAISALGPSKNKALFVGKLDAGAGSLIQEFTETVHDFSISDSDELLYSITDDQSLLAYAYNLRTGGKKNIFSVPFREATIVWGSTATSSHFVYPKTTYALLGFLYEIKNANLTRLPLGGFGFSALANSEVVLYTAHAGAVPKSYFYDLKTKTTSPLETILLPEKCYLANTGTTFFCGSESVPVPYEFPDSWYMGAMGFKDILWAVSASRLTSELLLDTYASTNREVDVINLELNPTSDFLYFTNKNDNTLWLYEI